MGVPVSSFDDFQAKLERFQDRSAIFGFLLYDSRPSQRVVAAFTQEQAPWIDDLARQTGIYFFFPFETEGKAFRNPSPNMARLFGLRPERLPGVVLFAPPRSDGRIPTKHAVYLPLAERDFGDARLSEPLFIDLFQLIGNGLQGAASSHEALVAIRDEARRLRRRGKRRGAAQYLRRGAHILLFQVPAKLYGPFAEGFGKALGGAVAGGSGG